MKLCLRFLIFKIIAFVSVIGSLFIACDLLSAIHSGGGIPDILVGNWGVGDTVLLTINKDKSGIFSDQECRWSVSGDRLTLTIQSASGSVKYEIDGNKLKLLDPQGDLAGLLDGCYNCS